MSSALFLEKKEMEVERVLATNSVYLRRTVFGTRNEEVMDRVGVYNHKVRWKDCRGLGRSVRLELEGFVCQHKDDFQRAVP